MSCEKCFRHVQFPGAESTCTNITIGYSVYPEEWTVEDIVTNDPRCYYDWGMDGQYTLHTIIIDAGMDISFTGTTTNTIVIDIKAAPSFVGGRPDDKIRK